MKDLVYLIIFNWIFALVLILFGVWRLKKLIKETDWDSHYLTYEIFINGLVFSIGCIVMGVIIIYLKIMGIK
jgi:hypothetical protein